MQASNIETNIEESQQDLINAPLSLSNINSTFNLCAQTTTSDPSGTFYDPGGPSGDYGNNDYCTLLISDPCVLSITLSFISFNTESGYDYLRVYDGNSASASLLGTFVGTSLPSDITSSGSELFIVWDSDGSVIRSGFEVNWSMNIGSSLPLTTIANANTNNPAFGQSVDFSDLSIETPYEWLWDFGDGNTSTEQNPIHSYQISGIQTVVLTATNCTYTDTDTIYIDVQDPGEISTNPTSLNLLFPNCEDSMVSNIWVYNSGNGPLNFNTTQLEYSDNFEQAINPNLWASTTGSISSSCGSNSGTSALYFDDNTSREVVTQPLTLDAGTQIGFHLHYGSGSSPCDNIETGKAISIGYSTNGGASYSNIESFSSISSYYDFNSIVFTIPAGTEGIPIVYRIKQFNFDGAGFDNWAIDDFFIGIPQENIYDNFEQAINPNLWASTTGVISSNCGSNSGTTALYFDDNSVREAISQPLTLGSETEIGFHLHYGSGSAPCDAIETGKAVSIGYSIDGGVSYTNIQFISNFSDYYDFNSISFNLPTNAIETPTIFRIRQANFDGTGFDNWAIDDFFVQENEIISSGSTLSLIPSFGSIPQGDSLLLELTTYRNELTKGNHYPSLSLETNDPQNPIYKIPLSYDISGVGILSYQTDCIAFDTIQEFAATMDSLYLYNTGCDTILIGNINSTDAFFQHTITGNEIPPNDSVLVNIDFNPQTFGIFTDSILFTYDGIDTFICLEAVSTGAPIIGATPNPLDVIFPNCEDSIVTEIWISNTGNGDLEYLFNPVLTDDFDQGVLNPNIWESTTGILSAPCGAFSGNSTLYFNSNNLRQVTTLPFSLASNATLGFQLLYASEPYGTGTGACEIVDPGEYVQLQYSIDGGTTYNNIASYSNISDYYSFTSIVASPPADAIGVPTKYRLKQINFQDPYDHWSIDDFYIEGSNSGIISMNPESGIVPVDDSLLVQVTIQRDELTVGSYIDSLSIVTNDPTQVEFILPVNYTVQQSQVMLSFEAPCLDYTAIQEFDSIEDSIYIYNTGCAEITIANMSVSDPYFQFSTQGTSILPYDSLLINVGFYPTTEGIFSETFDFTYDGIDTSICLNAASLGAPLVSVNTTSPNILFPNCEDSINSNAWIHNTGNGPLYFYPSEFMYFDNFEQDINSSLWASTTGVIQSFCGSNSGSTALYFNNNTAREIVSQPLTLEAGTEIGFHLHYGSGNFPCDAVEVGKAVSIGYSFDGGNNYINLQSFSSLSDYHDFNSIVFTVPANTVGVPVTYRIRQANYIGSGFDNWAIDDFFVRAPQVDYIYDNFEQALNPNIWASTTGSVESYCGANTGSTALYFNNNTAREAVTIPLTLDAGTKIGFSLKYGSGNFPCDSIETGKAASIGYSTDGGISYTNIQSFTGISDYFNFKSIEFTIPANTVGIPVIYRIRQANFTGAGHDNWAIDDFFIQELGTNNNTLSSNPAFGVIPEGDSLLIDITTYRNELALGNYYTSLILDTNDPQNPTYSLPLSYNISGSGILSYQTDCVTFDTIQEFSSTMDSLYLYNTGCDTILIGNMATTHPSFQDSITSNVIPPNDSLLVNIDFNPQTFGIFNDSIQFTYDGIDTFICLEAFVIGAPTIGTNPYTVDVIFPNCEDSIITDIWITNTGNGDLEFNASPVSFTDDFDQGTLNSEIWDASTTGILSNACGTFSGNSALYFNNNSSRQASTLPFSLSSDATIGFQLHYASGNGTCEQMDNGEYVRLLYSIDNGATYNTIANYSTINNYYNFTAIVANPPADAIGVPTIYQIKQNSFSGSCCDHWSIDDFYITGLNSSLTNLNPKSGIVPAGDSLLVQVTTQRDELTVGNYNDTLFIETNDPAQPEFILPINYAVQQNQAMLSFEAPCFDFATIQEFESTTSSMYMYNTGCDEIIIGNMSTSNSYFQFSSPGTSILPYDSLLVDVSFNPTSGGIFNETLDFTYDGIDTSICLNASSLGDPIISSNSTLSSILFPNCEDSIISNVWIHNTGSGPLNFQQSNLIYFDDFEQTINSDLWLSTTGVIQSYCGANSGSTALYFNNNTAREIVSQPLTLEAGTEIGFHLRYGSGSFPCDSIESGKGVSIGYSTNGGTSYTNLQSFSSLSDYHDFNSIVFTVPTNVVGLPVTYRIRQTNYAGSGFDNWAIDDFFVRVPQAELTYDNFEQAINPNIWASTTGVIQSYCGANTGSTALYFNNNNTAREVVSIPLTLDAGTTIGFSLKYGSGNFPCDSLEAGKAASIGYSTDGGTSYTNIQTFTGISDYFNFKAIEFTIPTSTVGIPVIYRIRQANFTGAGHDNWAIDDFFIQEKIGNNTLSMNPSLGVIPQGDSLLVEVTTYRDELTIGSYNTSLILESNDPQNVVYILPLNYTISGTGILSYQADCILFDTIQEFASNMDSIYLYNTGCDTILIDNINPSNPYFQHTIASNAILPNDSVLINIEFNPQSFGTFNDTLYFTYDGVDTSICLEAVAIAAPIMGMNPNPLNVIFPNCEDSIVTDVWITNTGNAELEFNATKISLFDDFDQGILNPDIWDTTTGILSAPCGSFSGSSTLYFNNTIIRQATTLPFSLSSDATLGFHLLYGSSNGSCEIVDPGEHVQLQYSIDDGITYNVIENYSTISDYFSFTAIVANPPVDAIDVPTKYRLIQNVFQNPYDHWSIDDFYIEGGSSDIISMNPESGMVPFGDSLLVQVTVYRDEQAGGNYSDSLSIDTNDPQQPKFFLPVNYTIEQSESLISFEAPCIDFGTVQELSTKEDSLYLYNSGCVEIVLGSMSTSHPDFQYASISTSIPPYDSLLINISFNPTGSGVFNETLDFTYDGIDTSICLTASSILAPLASINPSILDVSFMNCEDSIVSNVWLYNTGNSSLDFDASGYTYFDGFEQSSPNANIWASTTGEISGSCGSKTGVSALYFDDDLTREAISQPLTLDAGTVIGFNLHYGSGSFPCDSMEAGKAISIGYTTDGGSSYTNVQTFTGITDYHDFKSVEFTIPTNTAGVPVVYRIRQANFVGAGFDNWAFDDFFIRQPAADGINFSVSPAIGTILQGDSILLEIITQRDNVIDDGSISIPIITNDPQTPIFNIPVNLSILGNGILSFQMDCLEFDTIEEFSSTISSIYLSNTGCDTILIDNINPSNPYFQHSLASNQIPPNDSILINIDFNPLSPGLFNDTLYFTYDGIDTTICLEAFVLGIPSIGSNPDTLDIIFPNCEDSIVTNFWITNTGNGVLEYDAGVIDLNDDFDQGALNPDIWASSTGILSNSCGSLSGNSALYFYNGSSRQAITLPLTLPSNASLGFHLRYGSGGSPCENVDPGDYIALEYSINNGVSYNTIESYTNVTGYDNFTQIIATPPSNAIGVPTRYRIRQPSFSGGSYDHWAIDDFFIDNVNNSDAANINPVTGTVPPGDSLLVQFTIHNDDLVAGDYSTTLSIQTNDPLQPEFILPINYTIQQSQASLSFETACIDFGIVPDMTTISGSLYLYNLGCDEIIIDNPSTSNPDFNFIGQGTTIPPYDSVQINVNFTPSSINTIFSDTLYFSYNGIDTSICLMAESIGLPLIGSNPTSLDLIIGDCQNSVTTNLWLTNTGDAPLDFNVEPTILIDDFEAASVNSDIWSSTTGTISNSCGSNSGNTALYFNNSAVREAITKPFTLGTNAEIGFHLHYGSGNAPCEAIDVGKAVSIAYSTNGGLSYNNIQSFSVISDYYNFAQVIISIPANAVGVSAVYRVRQTNFTSTFDNWSIDDFYINNNSNNNSSHITMTPSSGSIPVGDSLSIEVTVDRNDQGVNIYDSGLFIYNNSLDLEYFIPLMYTIEGIASNTDNVFICDPNIGDLYVDAAATGLNDGTSWSNAFIDLQNALAIGANKTIHIAEGIYLPTTSTSRTISFNIPDGSTLLGGYPTGGGTRDSDTYMTNLSGEIDGVAGNAGNSHHVVKTQGVNCITIDGLTVENGNADDASSFGRARGGGLYIHSSEVLLSNIKVQNNAAIYGGGTFAFLSPNVTIISSDYNNNTADNGSALYHSNETNMYIFDSRIINNNSLIRSAIEVNNSLYTRIENSVIANNESVNSNAIALIATNRDQTFDAINCTILGETKNKYLVSMQIGSGNRLDANFYNTIIGHQNIAFDRAVIIYSFGVLNLKTENCYIQGSSITGTTINNLYSDTAGDLMLNADYSVNECSPVVNSGNDVAAPCLLFDIDGNDRFFSTVDIGAYEAQTNCPPSSRIEISNILIYPNPTSGMINIKSEDENISILIYDLLGRKLIETQSLEINISDFPAGIYMINVLNESNQIIHKEKVVKN